MPWLEGSIMSRLVLAAILSAALGSSGTKHTEILIHTSLTCQGWLDSGNDDKSPAETPEGRLVLELQKLIGDPNLDADIAATTGQATWTFKANPGAAFNRNAFQKVFREHGGPVQKMEVRVTGTASKDDKGVWRFEAEESKSKFRIERSKAKKKK